MKQGLSKASTSEPDFFRRVVGSRHDGANGQAPENTGQVSAGDSKWSVGGWPERDAEHTTPAFLLRQRRPIAHGLAVLGALLGMLLHVYVLPSHELSYYYLFLGVAVTCVYVGGLGPGLLAVGLGAVVSSAGMIWEDDLTGYALANLGLYVAVSVAVCALVTSWRASRESLRTSQASLHLLLERMPVVAWSTDRELRITSSEGGSLSALRLAPHQMVGAPLLDYLQVESPQRAAIAIKAHQRALEGKASTYQMEWQGRLFQVHIEPLRNPQGEVSGTVAAALDVTESHRTEREQALRHEIMRIFAESPSLLEGVQRLLAVLGQALDWDVAVYWTVDRETKRQRCSALWHRVGVVELPFLAETESLSYRAEACLPGRAWMSGAPIWIPNVAAELSFRRADVAAASSLRGGLWLPLPPGNGVSGVLEFLNRSGRQPDAAVRGLLSDICRQLAEFSRRWRAEETTTLLAAVLESTPDLVGISDLAGRPLHINRAGRRMLGLSQDEDLKRFRLGEFSPPWAARIVLEEGVPAAVEHGIWEGETAILNRQTGKEIPVSQVIVCHKRPDGSPEFLSTINRDITERKRAESQGRLSHRVLQTTNALVLVADERLNIRYASPSLHPMLGYKPSEVMGRNFWTLGVHSKDDRRELLRYLTEAARGRIAARERAYEMRMVHRDGSERWVLWQDSVGADNLIIRVGQDVTEQRQMQQALARRAAQQEAIAALGREALAATDPVQVMQSAIAGVARNLGAAFCCVLERLPGEAVILRAAVGGAGERMGSTLAQERAAGDALLRSAAAMWRAAAGEENGRAPGNGVSIPIQGKAGSLGALGVCREAPGEFSNDHLNYLEAVAHILGSVVERTRADQALHLSSARLRAVVNGSPLPITIIDNDGLVQLWNPAAERVFGWSESEVLGQRIPIIPAAADSEFAHLKRIILEGGTVDRMPVVRRNKAGEAVEVLLSAAPIRDAAGSVCGSMAVVADVTERLRTERALAESERKFRAVAETAANAIYIHDGTRLVFVNQTAQAISGYSREELLEKDIWAFVHPDFRELVRQRAAARFQGESAPVRYEYKIVTKDGEERWLDTSNALVTFDGRRAVLATAFDVTDRKLAEMEQGRLQQAIERAAAEWRLTFDVIDSIIVIVTAEGMVKRLNRCAQTTCGLSFDTALGRNLAALGPGEPWKTAAGLAAAAAANRPGFRRAQDRENGTVWDIHVTPFHTPAAEMMVMVRAQDVTATVELQRMLVRSEKMAAMGALVGGVAHEVRNPLFAISATLDAFETRFGDSPEQERYMKSLRSEFGRLDALMHDLLEYGKPAGLERTAGCLQDVMREVLERARPLARKQAVELRLQAPQEPVVLRMDVRRIGEMLQNMVANALQHAPPESAVECSLEVRPGEDGLDAVCVVRDHGPGFPVHDMEKLFEPFFSRRKGGTGLGLPIVLRIAEDHGGRAHLQNAPDGGAVATVILPAEGDDQAARGEV